MGDTVLDEAADGTPGCRDPIADLAARCPRIVDRFDEEPFFTVEHPGDIVQGGRPLGGR